MIRFMLWMVLVVLTLNVFSFRVRYSDGLVIKSTGWPEKLFNWLEHKKVKS